MAISKILSSVHTERTVDLVRKIALLVLMDTCVLEHRENHLFGSTHVLLDPTALLVKSLSVQRVHLV